MTAKRDVTFIWKDKDGNDLKNGDTVEVCYPGGGTRTAKVRGPYDLPTRTENEGDTRIHDQTELPPHEGSTEPEVVPNKWIKKINVEG